MTTFRQEKFVAFGGPDGGDGGKGGDVYLLADDNMSTLLDFKYKSFFKAEDGSKGARSNRTGASGGDLLIKVPVGTIVKDSEDQRIIADLKKSEDKVMVASGGRGGRGNTRFKSNRLKAPNFCEPGEAGIEREIELELKLIADVGIIGMPNAGKSTMISKLSAAKPKIADYAFTTIKPNLGVVKKHNGDAFVMADIPGLIEGASEGEGLGHQFLRHIERCKLLIHVVDIWGFSGTNVKEHQAKTFDDPITNFTQINYELDHYSKKLSAKKQIIVLNKIEGYPDGELKELIQRFEEITGLKISSFEELENKDLKNSSNFFALFAVSNLSGEGLGENYERENKGLKKLQEFVESALELDLNEDEEELIIEEDFKATDHDDSNFSIHVEDLPDKAGKIWFVACGKLERMMRVTDLQELDALNHLFKATKGLGVIEAIKTKGAQPGDVMNIDGVDFDISDAVFL